MVKISSGDSDPTKTGGGLVDKNGKYRVQVVDVKEDDSQITVKYKVTGGENPDQVGRVLSNWLKFPANVPESQRESAGNALCRTAVSMGVLDEKDWKAAVEAGDDIDFDLEDGIDTECVIEVLRKKKDDFDESGEYWTNITKSWRLDDPAVKSIAGNVETPSGDSSSSQSSDSSSSQSSDSSGGGDDDFDWGENE